MQDLLSEIQLFAGTFVPMYHTACEGQRMSIANNSTLYSLMGSHYGGDDKTYFLLPKIAPTADGMFWNIETYAGPLGMPSDQGCFGINAVGEIGYFGGQSAPINWAYCDGSSLLKDEHPALFEVIGYTYGGSEEEFNLPNLPAIPPADGSTGDTKALIRLRLNAHFVHESQNSTLASIVQWSGSTTPNELFWQACDGQLMSIEENMALFSLLGTHYGGDGEKTFALPKIETGNDTIYIICIQGIFPARS